MGKKDCLGGDWVGGEGGWFLVMEAWREGKGQKAGNLI